MLTKELKKAERDWRRKCWGKCWREGWRSTRAGQKEPGQKESGVFSHRDSNAIQICVYCDLTLCYSSLLLSLISLLLPHSLSSLTSLSPSASAISAERTNNAVAAAMAAAALEEEEEDEEEEEEEDIYEEDEEDENKDDEEEDKNMLAAATAAAAAGSNAIVVEEDEKDEDDRRGPSISPSPPGTPPPAPPPPPALVRESIVPPKPQNLGGEEREGTEKGGDKTQWPYNKSGGNGVSLIQGRILPRP